MIIKEIINRRSVREFQDQIVKDEDVEEIIRAGFFAPNSRGNYAEEFIVIKDQKIKQEIFDIIGQDFICQAPILIIPVTDTTKTSEPIQDISVISENIFLQATALGLGTVWQNISPELMENVRPIIKLPKNFIFINIIALGYAIEIPAPHLDADFDPAKIHRENW